MKFNKLIKFTLIIALFTILAESVDAQSRRRSKKEVEEETLDQPKFTDKLFGDVLLGNISFGTLFQFSIKPEVGYKVIDRLGVGINCVYNYAELNQVGADDLTASTFGYGLFLRGKISDFVYLQVDGTRAKLDAYDSNIGGYVQQNVTFPTISLGYFSGSEKWKYGFQLGYVANEIAQDTYGVLTYWFGIQYNF
ncbi:MAG: hypothetical protein R2766_12020 [Saprospiraceae bacterium]